MLIIVTRVIILYTIVVIVMRLMGKRQIGQLQPYELATAILISELAAVPMQDTGIPLLYGIIPILILLILQIILSLITLKNDTMNSLICGKPRILIEKGRIVEQNLADELYNINDLLEQLRINNYADINNVEYAILETSGQLSIIPKSNKRAVTPEDISAEVSYDDLPYELIVDGKIIMSNLKKAGMSLDKLNKEIKKIGIKKPEQVFLACIDSKGKLYLQKKDEKRCK